MQNETSTRQRAAVHSADRGDRIDRLGWRSGWPGTSCELMSRRRLPRPSSGEPAPVVAADAAVPVPAVNVPVIVDAALSPDLVANTFR